MSRFRLRYKSTTLELSPGDFTIGRSSGCSLAVADALVSRRHAVLHVGSSKVVVQDLGSRNGIVVNGVQHRGSCRLNHMDCIYIGTQELVLIDGTKVSIQPEAGPNVICESCGAVNGSTKRRCAECGRRLKPMAGTTEKDPPNVAPGWITWAGEDTQNETARDVIDGIAAKAIEFGRFEDARQGLCLQTLRSRCSPIWPSRAPSDGFTRSEHQAVLRRVDE